MKTFFITSSGTEIGKTFVTTCLLGELRGRDVACQAIKPVMSGFDVARIKASDAAVLLGAQGRPIDADSVADISPWRFTEPLSPDLAAAREGRVIDFDELVRFCRQPREVDVLLIEGIGGVMVPLDESHTVLDWIAELSAPALLVVGSYLGSISHTLTATACLKQRDIAVAGVVISESTEGTISGAELARTLTRFLPRTRIVVIPRKENGQVADLPDLIHLLET
jgi:dethiobiotin synthetase